MSLRDYALTTLARQKVFLSIDSSNTVYDTVLTYLINAATDAIESYTRRRFHRTAYSNKEYTGNDSQELLLGNFPVDDSQSFIFQYRNSFQNTDDWTTEDSEDYYVDYDEGVVYWLNNKFRSSPPRQYRFSFTAGFYVPQDTEFNDGTDDDKDLPLDLELATWLLVAKVFNKRRGGSGVSSVNLEGAGVSFIRDILLDNEVRGILDSYRRLEV